MSQSPEKQRNQVESIIPPLADFDDDVEDDDDDQLDEKELTADEIYQNALGGRWGEGLVESMLSMPRAISESLSGN
ncbi:hypothetical protein BGX29_006761 [Mortierella sp. GBA35]|nr:hypothetical protein BGX29_006761 [Mortierella sp. GBA35]